MIVFGICGSPRQQATEQILKEALREELGIPMLIIDLDVGDERLTNINIVRDKISMFTQTLM